MAGLLGSPLSFAQTSVSLSITGCYQPVETYPYKLDRAGPLYETARTDHQRYLEEMETYVNCLDRERSNALHELQSSFRLF